MVPHCEASNSLIDREFMADFREVAVAAGFLLAGVGAGYYGGMVFGSHENSVNPSSRVGVIARSSLSSNTGKVKASAAAVQIKDQLLGMARREDDPMRELAMAKVILGMDANTVQQVLESLPAGKDNESRLLQRELVARWAHLDPEAALAYAEKQPVPTYYIRSDCVDIALKAWGDVNPQAALQAAGKIFSKNRGYWSSSEDGAVSNMLDKIAGADGSGAFDWAKTHLGSREYSGLSREVTAYLAKINPQWAAEIAQQLPPSSDYMSSRRMAMSAVASAWAEKDPAAAMAWAQSLGALDRPDAFSQILSRLSQDDPKSAAQYFLKAPEWISQRMWSGQVFTSWIAKDPKEAEAWVKQLPEGAQKKKAYEAYLNGLSQVDVKAAAELLLTLPAKETPHNALWQVSYQLWSEDRNQALDWLHKLPEGNGRQNATSNMYNQWADEDPHEAAQYIIDHETGDNQSRAMEMVAMNWSRNDPESAWGFAQGMPSGKSRNQVMNSILTAWSSESPQKAAAMISSLPESERGSAVQNIAREWVQSDASAATAWVSSLPEGEGKKNAYQGLVGGWIQYDSTKAASWLMSQPPGAPRDAALEWGSQMLSNDDPATAAGLAVTIANADTRDNRVRDVVNNWMHSDPSAAKAWVSASSLPQAVKDKLVKQQ